MIDIEGSNNGLKCWIFKQGLRLDYMLKQLGLEGTCSLIDLLNRDQPYFNYEEELLVEENTQGERNPKHG